MFSPLYHKCGASSHQQNFSFRNWETERESHCQMRMRVSKSHLHCLVCGLVASVGPFGVASVVLRLCFVLSYSYFLFPNLYWLPSNLPGSSHPAPCWFLAFFCFLFAPDKRLIVVCYLLPRSWSSWLPNWHSLLHQAERFGLPSASSFSHSKWSEYKQKLYWSISVVLCLFFFSVLLFLSIFMFRFVVSL